MPLIAFEHNKSHFYEYLKLNWFALLVLVHRTSCLSSPKKIAPTAGAVFLPYHQYLQFCSVRLRSNMSDFSWHNVPNRRANSRLLSGRWWTSPAQITAGFAVTFGHTHTHWNTHTDHIHYTPTPKIVSTQITSGNLWSCFPAFGFVVWCGASGVSVCGLYEWVENETEFRRLSTAFRCAGIRHSLRSSKSFWGFFLGCKSRACRGWWWWWNFVILCFRR